jgi:hypothetical protein
VRPAVSINISAITRAARFGVLNLDERHEQRHDEGDNESLQKTHGGAGRDIGVCTFLLQIGAAKAGRSRADRTQNAKIASIYGRIRGEVLSGRTSATSKSLRPCRCLETALQQDAHAFIARDLTPIDANNF